ncbi:MAG: hypothetical protein ACTHLE_17995 [Agriterribacter sp.]
MRVIFTPLLLVFLSGIFSCDRIKAKGRVVVNGTKEKIKNAKDKAVDQVLPTFDSYTPDTKFNKKRFEEFFGFAPTPDVSNIYCFGDQMGIDSKFFFSFTCDTVTRDRIVSHLKLSPSSEPGSFGSGLWRDFPWWDSATIMTLHPFKRKGEHEYYQYLWYDNRSCKLYYMDFDM